MKYLLRLFLPLLIPMMVQGQNLDSLRRIVLDPLQPDSERLWSFHDLIWDGYMGRDADSALVLADSMRRFAHRTDLHRHEGNACSIRARVYVDRGEHANALLECERGLLAFERIGYVKGQAGCWNTIAIVHTQKGEHQKAIAAYEKAMELNERIGDKKGVAQLLNNIGLVYFSQDDYSPAIEHLHRAITLSKEVGDAGLTAQALLNICSCYSRMGDHAKAVDYCMASRALCDSIGFEPALPGVLTTLGASLLVLGRSEEAEANLRRAVELADRFGDKPNGTLANVSLGRVLLAHGDARGAIRQGERGLALAEQTKGILELRDATEFLHEAYKSIGDRSNALLMYERFIIYRDSTKSEENQRSLLRYEYRSEYEKQALTDSLQHASETALQIKEIQKQKLVRNGFMGGFALVALFAGIFFTQRNRISKAKARSEELLLNILPAEVAEELKATGEAQAVQIDQVTVLFSDFKGFTSLSEKLTPKELVRDLNECFSAFDHIMTKYGIEKIKTIGDAYMAAGGLPVPNATHAVDVIKAGLEMRDFIAEGKARKQVAGQPFFEIRIGVHTGPVVAGIVGVKKFAYDIWGDTVNTASRMESSGEVGQVNISEATYALVKDERLEGKGHNPQPATGPAFRFTPRGKVQAKGKGEMEMYFVEKHV